jgi:hypothetical protein
MFEKQYFLHGLFVFNQVYPNMSIGYACLEKMGEDFSCHPGDPSQEVPREFTVKTGDTDQVPFGHLV